MINQILYKLFLNQPGQILVQDIILLVCRQFKNPCILYSLLIDIILLEHFVLRMSSNITIPLKGKSLKIFN